MTRATRRKRGFSEGEASKLPTQAQSDRRILPGSKISCRFRALWMDKERETAKPVSHRWDTDSHFPMSEDCAIVPWATLGFFLTALVLLLLAFAVRTGFSRYQLAAQELGLTIGLVALVLVALMFLWEHAWANRVQRGMALL